MLEAIKKKIKEWFNKMFNKSTIENKANVNIAVSDVMSKAIDTWTKIYEDKADWVNNNTVFSMNLGAGIAAELARLVTIEFKSEISNNDFLNQEYQAVVDNIRNYTEYACAKGGLAFKPYVSNGHIEVDLVQADAFFPTAYNSRGDITGAVFIETKTEGENTYTRLEYHNLTKEGYLIRNAAYKKKNLNQLANSNSNTLGDEIPLSEVEEWSSLEPEVTIKNIDKPLFSYFKMPLANTVDSSSPLGVSVYSRIAERNGLLEQIDKQYSYTLWEYESKQTSIDASVDFFKRDSQGNPILPSGKERLYRALDIASDDKTSGWNIFSPDIRDASLFNGLNELLRQAEFQCGIAYGTFSKADETAKTATEIKSSKQRSYQQVKDIQKALQNALENLAYAMSVYGQLYRLGAKPVKATDMTFSFDDSIIVDKDSELDKMYLDVSSGIIKPEFYIMEKYGVDLKTALQMMPNTEITDNPLDQNTNPITGLPN